MKSKKGISLIVLIITIIVMLVLAGAIILTLNNSGILTKAEDAVESTNLAQVKQFVQLKWAEAYADGARTKVELETAIAESLKGMDLTAYDIDITESGVTVELKNTSTDEEENTQGGTTTPVVGNYVTNKLNGGTLSNRNVESSGYTKVISYREYEVADGVEITSVELVGIGTLSASAGWSLQDLPVYNVNEYFGFNKDVSMSDLSSNTFYIVTSGITEDYSATYTLKFTFSDGTLETDTFSVLVPAMDEDV